jgi:hypothetical protein
MTITLELPEPLQQQAEALASARGESVERVALDLLAESLAVHAGSLPTRTERQTQALIQVRQLAAEHGLDWDQLDEAAREQWIDERLHEG